MGESCVQVSRFPLIQKRLQYQISWSDIPELYIYRKVGGARDLCNICILQIPVTKNLINNLFIIKKIDREYFRKKNKLIYIYRLIYIL